MHWLHENIMWCVGKGGEGAFGGVARKALGIVSNHFSLLWYGKSDMLGFFFFIISYHDNICFQS